MSNRHEAVVRSIYEAFNTKNIPQLLSALAPHFELLDLATGQTFHTPQGFLQWVAPWIEGTPDARTELHTVAVAGNLVFTEHTGRGTQTGPLKLPGGTFAPSGRRFEAKFGEIFEFEGEQITKMRAYWDTASVMQQLGHAAAPWRSTSSA